MSIGKKITEARKKAGKTLAQLAGLINMSVSGIAKIENDGVKNTDPNTLVKIADALNDISILFDHCQACPIKQQIFLKQFPDLNNIRRDPAIIASRLRKEMAEAIGSADSLAERYSNRDYKSRPDYQEAFEKDMEQIIDVQRNIEVLMFELVLSGAHSSSDLKKVYEIQQKKCEERGHHHPEQGDEAE